MPASKPQPPEEPTEPQYAVDPADRIHRIASVCVLAVLIGLGWHRNGIRGAIGIFRFEVLPMACIWFPEALENMKNYRGGFGRFDFPSPARFLRWAGWFVLLVVPVALLYLL